MLAYDRFGTGAHAVIALHGWFGDQTTFAPLYDALDPTAFTWICPSYRGYGGSKAIAGEFTIDEIAQDALELAEALGLETFSLVGHSMGGKAVQRVLAMAPSRVRSIVAIAPVPASGVPFDDATYKLFESAVANFEAACGIVGFSVGGRLAKTWIERVAAHPKKVATDAAFSTYLKSWARGDFHQLIEGNPVPIKVVIGEHDQGLNEALMRATYLRWYPNAVLEIMPNSGHYPINETPIALATSIESFLKSAS